MKVLFGMALRQTTGFVESLLSLIGLNWEVPDFSTLSRRQKTLAVNVPYRGSKEPLHLLIDSTGIKIEGEGEWNARRHGGPKRRVWRKIHLGIDEQRLEVRAVEITGNHIGDAPVLPDLLSQIPADEQIGSVTADGAYDTRKCHDAIAERGAHAVIPPGLRPFRAELIHRINSRPPFTLAGTPSPGNPRQQAQSRATRRFARRNTSVAPSGETGPNTTAEAASKRRCTV